MPREQPIASIFGRIVRVVKKPATAPKGKYRFRGLELSHEEDGDRIFLMFPEFWGETVYDFPLMCCEGMELMAHGLELNNRLDQGAIIYTVTQGTLLVLEPFRPVSVTEAVKATTCLRSVDARLRDGSEEPFWMAKGKMIHGMLESVLRHSLEEWPPAFEEAYQDALPSFMPVLPGTGVKVDEEAFRDELRTHFEHICSWVSQNRDKMPALETEVDVVSTALGLKGRADALLHQEDSTSILELKTGKYEDLEHVAQLVAYSLIFESRCGKRVDPLVLYSAKGMSRSCREQAKGFEAIVPPARNMVVGLKHAHTLENQNDIAPLLSMKCPPGESCFSKKTCMRLYGGHSGKGALLSGKEKKYYDKWFRLLSIEDWNQEGDFAAILDPRTREDRVRDGITIPIREMAVVRPGRENRPEPVGAASEGKPPALAGSMIKDDRVTLELRTHGATATEIQPGEEVLLHAGDPCGPEVLRGRVLKVLGESLSVSLKVPFSVSGAPAVPALLQADPEDGIFLDRIPFSKGRQASRHALFRFFVKADPQVLAVVVHGEQKAKKSVRKSVPAIPENSGAASQHPANEADDDLCFSEGLLAELNEKQEAAIRAALDCETYHLVHGPPGTGKTRVLARLIRACLDRGERLLVVCPTNVALDRLLLSVVELGVKSFLRVGGRSSVSREFLEALDRLGSPPALLADLARAGLSFDAFRKHVEDTMLIGATAYQAATHPIFLRQKFHRAIVDEAGQLDEPSTLGALSLAPKFVLCGDHLQLPPVVQSRRTDLDTGSAPGLEQSLFERLYRSAPKRRISPLLMQYRMNREVQDLPSRLFYEGSLFPSPDAAGRRLCMEPGVSSDPQINRIIDPALPVVFVDVPGTYNGKASPQEAELACAIVESLLASGVAPAEIGIISPYRAQQALIRGKLSEKGISHPMLSVDTVDRFQGGEREAIILSLARSDGVTSFLADRKRLNVSLSRARSKLILMGHGPVLDEHPLFKTILEGMERITVNARA